jgi:flagellar L-ring protein FlgH
MMNKSSRVLILSFFAGVMLMGSGCATINKLTKSLFGGKEEKVAKGPTKFSETENVKYNADLNYRRMNRNRFEEEAEVKASAGSLWVMEGQGAYLFAQNTTRLVGDILNVRVDGTPKMQLQTKTKVIAKLLARLDKSDRPQNIRGPASAQVPAALAQQQAQQPNQNQQPNQDPNAVAAQGIGGQQPGQGIPGQAAPGAPEVVAPFAVESVPTRVVEVLRDGSYRVRGTQEFMIGKREYRVIVTGIVRQEDFNEEGISADRLLDSQFDIVSAKRGASL